MNRREKRGEKVYLDSPQKTMHAEGGVEQRRVFIGTHNLPHQAPRHHSEMSVLIDKPGLAQEMRRDMVTIIEEAK